MARGKAVNRTPLTAAQRALVEEYAEWAVTGARKYFAMGNRLLGQSRFTLDELTSAAYWGLVQAARRYDPALGFTFKTYAFNWCEQALRREWQLDQRHGHGFRWRQKGETCMAKIVQRVEWPRDRETGEQLDLPAPPAVDQGAADRLADQRALAMAACRDDRDRAILAGRLDGKTMVEVGVELGVSRGLIWLREQDIIRRARLAAAGIDPNTRAAKHRGASA